MVDFELDGVKYKTSKYNRSSDTTDIEKLQEAYNNPEIKLKVTVDNTYLNRFLCYMYNEIEHYFSGETLPELMTEKKFIFWDGCRDFAIPYDSGVTHEEFSDKDAEFYPEFAMSMEYDSGVIMGKTVFEFKVLYNAFIYANDKLIDSFKEYIYEFNRKYAAKEVVKILEEK